MLHVPCPDIGGNTPSPMSSPADIGSFTNAVTAFAEFIQLSLLAGAGIPVTVLDDRSCMMKIATGVSVTIVSVTTDESVMMNFSGVSLIG